MKTLSRRETRGMSRSKCAETATILVPACWAGVILSGDADFVNLGNGFGTSELIVSSGAYRWG